MTNSSPPEFDGPQVLRRALRHWRLLFFAYFLLLTVGTHLPQANLRGAAAVMPDKLFHLVGFGLLAMLLWRARLLPLTWMTPVAVAIWLPLDEWTQGWVGPGRTVAIDDMIAGWMGVTAATAVIFVLSGWGPPPLQVTRLRFLLLLDIVAARPWNAIHLILLPVAICVSGFFALLYVLPAIFPTPELLGIAPPLQQSQYAFVAALIAGILYGFVALLRLLPPIYAFIEKQCLCFSCGKSQVAVQVPRTSSRACSGCQNQIYATQWLRLGPLAKIRFSTVILGTLSTILITLASATVFDLLLRDASLNFKPLPTDPTRFTRFAFLSSLTMPSLMLSAILGIASGIVVSSSLRARAAMQRGWTCPGCSFDLSQSRDEQGVRTCPECGMLAIDWTEQQLPGSFERHARTVMSMTAISRLTGLVREGILSRIFGTDAMLSSFYFAFLIPNLFRRLFGEGALAAAFLPVYERLNREDPTVARRLAAATLGVVLLIVGTVVAITEILLFGINLLGFEGENLAIWLMMIMLPYAPLVCLVALLGAMLQVHGRFGPTAAAPIILNLGIVVAAASGLAAATSGAAPTGSPRTVLLMAASVILAGVIQIAWSLYALTASTAFPFSAAGVRHHLREVFRKAGPMILGLGVLQVNTLIDGLIASYRNYTGTSDFFGATWPLDEHAMAVLTFAQRLYQFPLGVFGIAVATAIYPLLAQQASQRLDFSDTLRRGIRLVLFIGVPASLGLMAVATPLTGAVLQGGFFSEADTGQVAFVLLGYASCVWAYSLIQVITRAFYATGDTMTPVKIAVSVVGLNLLLNLVLIWTPLREAGLAWSTAICATLQSVILLRVLRRHVDNPIDRQSLRSIMQIVGLTVVMVALLAAVQAILPIGRAWIDQVRNLAILVVIGTMVFGGGAALLRMPELRWALGGRSTPPRSN